LKIFSECKTGGSGLKNRVIQFLRFRTKYE
jgi:hypothetical protein